MQLIIERNRRSENVMIEGAAQEDILPGAFRNFRGEKRKFNDEGKRNFNLALNLDESVLNDLRDLGLNIKTLAPRDGGEYGDEPLNFVKVNVALSGKFPPQLFLISGNKMKELSEGELGLLDGARFVNVDLVIRTYHRDGSDTCSLYLQKGYFTIEVDPISAKYANYDDEIPFPDDED